MEKRKKKETDILIEGKETQKLSQFISLKKLKTFLCVYNFINNFKVEKNRLPDYPCDELSALYKALNKLQKKGILKEGTVKKIKGEIDVDLFFLKYIKFTHGYWEGKTLEIRNGEEWIIKKKAGRFSDDAVNILIFLLISHLIKSIKRPRYTLVDNFLDEKGIKIFKDVIALRKQFKRLNPNKLKERYEFYYDKSGAMEPVPGKGVMLYKTLPEWEELISQ